MTCQPRPNGWNRRCPLHGGLSTGPRTVEGRQRKTALTVPERAALLAAVGDAKKPVMSRLFARVSQLRSLGQTIPMGWQ